MVPLPSQKACKHHVFLLALFSSLVVSFGLFTYFMLMPFSQFASRAKLDTSFIKGDLRALKTSFRVAEFAEHDAYTNLSRDHDIFWREDLLPPNGGYFALAPTDKKSVGLGIAMFHQLRCLAVIRSEMQYLHEIIGNMRSGCDRTGHRRDFPPRHGLASGLPNFQSRYREYTMHCFDYLRQSLLCLSDATIEQPKQTDKGEPFIDGMGERVCKDWGILYRASIRSDDQPVAPGL